MTREQGRAVEYLRDQIIRHDGHSDNDYEYKRFDVRDVEPGGHYVFVVSEVGLKGDEGTLASIYCRTHRHISIGPRGGLTLLNAKHKSKRQGRRVLWALTEY